MLVASLSTVALVLLPNLSIHRRDGRTTVPMLEGQGPDARPLVSGRIGAWTGAMLVDTGSLLCAAPASVVATVGATPTKSLVPFMPYIRGQRKDPETVLLPSVAVGHVQVANVECWVLPDQELKWQGRTPYVVLGESFLARVAERFDFPRRKFTIWKPDRLDDTEIAALGFDPRNFVRWDATQPMVKLGIQARWAVDAFLDTGGVGTLLPSMYRYMSYPDPAHHFTVTNADRTIQVPAAWILMPTIASASSVDYITVGIAGKSQALPCAVIGTNLLAHFDVLLDPQRERAYFRVPVIATKARQSTRAHKRQ